jgi:hypothetical protein
MYNCTGPVPAGAPYRPLIKRPEVLVHAYRGRSRPGSKQGVTLVLWSSTLPGLPPVAGPKVALATDKPRCRHVVWPSMQKSWPEKLYFLGFPLLPIRTPSTGLCSF